MVFTRVDHIAIEKYVKKVLSISPKQHLDEKKAYADRYIRDNIPLRTGIAHFLTQLRSMFTAMPMHLDNEFLISGLVSVLGKERIDGALAPVRRNKAESLNGFFTTINYIDLKIFAEKYCSVEMKEVIQNLPEYRLKKDEYENQLSVWEPFKDKYVLAKLRLGRNPSDESKELLKAVGNRSFVFKLEWNNGDKPCLIPVSKEFMQLQNEYRLKFKFTAVSCSHAVFVNGVSDEQVAALKLLQKSKRRLMLED